MTSAETALENNLPHADERTMSRRPSVSHVVDDDERRESFPITGVCFVPTHWVDLDRHSGYGAARVVRPSEGPAITDFVTHQRDFAYGTYGIHVGQDDRLTFFGDGQSIVAHLIDCRAGSPTLGTEIAISFCASSGRVLVVPAGVAHTLDGLACVVTRDEPVWYADSNPDWDPDNDLISFPRDAVTAPVVQVNKQKLPVAAHLLISKMSQVANGANHAAYSARYQVNVGGEMRYVKVTPDWSGLPSLDELAGFPAVAALTNYSLTGPRSYTIVPSTDSCTSDVIELIGDGTEPETFVSHRLSERVLTWIGGTGLSWLSVGDEANTVHTTPMDDPRISFRIPPGTKYRLRAEGRNWYRSEMRLLKAAAGSDIVPGRDMQVHEVDDVRPQQVTEVVYVPGAALNALARAEAAAQKYL